jgi:SET domain-containing protein
MTVNREDLEVRRTSTGLGLFSLLPIPARRRIVEYLGPVVIRQEVEWKGGRYLFGLDGERALDGSSRANLARYVNHSCRPNAEAFVTGSRVWVWSKRAIAAGDEITLDYGAEYFDEFIRPAGCKCEACAAGAGLGQA